MVTNKIRSALARSIDRTLDLESLLIKRRARYIVCYHRVLSAAQAEDQWVHHSMWITPETFQSQVRWFQQVGEIVPYHRLLDFTQPNERPLFSITFDDGWRDNLTTALPILKSLKAPFTIFLTTSVLETGHLLWPDDLTLKTRTSLRKVPEPEVRHLIQALFPEPRSTDSALPTKTMLEEATEELKVISETERSDRLQHFFELLGIDAEPLRGQMMTWADALEMRKSGVHFGSHSHTHRICSEASAAELRYELETSMSQLESHLAIEIDAFAYPNARYKGTEAAILREMGYQCAFRLHNLPAQANTDPYFIPRYICSENTARTPGWMALRFLNVPCF